MAILPLSDLDDWQLVDSTQDLRGKRLVDNAGRQIGTVEQMIVNTDDERVESIRTDREEMFAVENLEIRGDEVILHTPVSDKSSGGRTTRAFGAVIVRRRLP